MKKLLLLLALALPLSHGFPPSCQKAEAAETIINKNGGFETGKTNWAASGGTFNITGTAANVGEKLFAASWDPSAASQTLSNDLALVPAGLYGKLCSASMVYKGGDSNYKFQVYDGSNIIAETDLVASTNYSARKVLYFTCPSSGSLSARLISSADAALIYLDDVRLGQDIVVASSAGYSGEAYMDGTANCSPNVTGALSSFGSDADCGPRTLVSSNGPASISLADSDNAKFTVNNLPAGEYLVAFTTRVDVTSNSTNVRLAVYDGTSLSGHTGGAPSTAVGMPVTVVGKFNYTSAGTRVYELYGGTDTGTVSIQNAVPTFQRVHFYIIQMKGGTEDAVTVDKMGWNISGRITGASPSLGTGNVTTYSEITNASLSMTLDSGSAAAEIPCSSTNPSTGLTCAAGNEGLGVVFVPPSAGEYEACFDYTWNGEVGTSSALYSVFRLDRTASNLQTVIEAGRQAKRANIVATSQGTWGFPFTMCDKFTIPDTTKTAIRLKYVQNGSGTVNGSFIDADFSNEPSGFRSFGFRVRRLNALSDTVKFSNLATTSRQLGVKVEFVKFTLDGSGCTIQNQSGAFSAPNRPSIGRCNMALTGFTTPPACMCLGEGNTARYCSPNASSNSTVQFTYILDGGGNDDPGIAAGVCVGF